MNFLLAPQGMDKTTIVLHYAYNSLLTDESNAEYAMIIVKRCSKRIDDLFFGKYSTVLLNVLNQMHIKYCEQYKDVIEYFEGLTYLSPDYYPHCIAIDAVTLFTEMVKIISFL